MIVNYSMVCQLKNAETALKRENNDETMKCTCYLFQRTDRVTKAWHLSGNYFRGTTHSRRWFAHVPKEFATRLKRKFLSSFYPVRHKLCACSVQAQLYIANENKRSSLSQSWSDFGLPAWRYHQEDYWAINSQLHIRLKNVLLRQIGRVCK